MDEGSNTTNTGNVVRDIAGRKLGDDVARKKKNSNRKPCPLILTEEGDLLEDSTKTECDGNRNGRCTQSTTAIDRNNNSSNNGSKEEDEDISTGVFKEYEHRKCTMNTGLTLVGGVFLLLNGGLVIGSYLVAWCDIHLRVYTMKNQDNHITNNHHQHQHDDEYEWNRDLPFVEGTTLQQIIQIFGKSGSLLIPLSVTLTSIVGPLVLIAFHSVLLWRMSFISRHWPITTNDPHHPTTTTAATATATASLHDPVDMMASDDDGLCMDHTEQSSSLLWNKHSTSADLTTDAFLSMDESTNAPPNAEQQHQHHHYHHHTMIPKGLVILLHDIQTKLTNTYFAFQRLWHFTSLSHMAAALNQTGSILSLLETLSKYAMCIVYVRAVVLVSLSTVRFQMGRTDDGTVSQTDNTQMTTDETILSLGRRLLDLTTDQSRLSSSNNNHDDDFGHDDESIDLYTSMILFARGGVASYALGIIFGIATVVVLRFFWRRLRHRCMEQLGEDYFNLDQSLFPLENSSSSLEDRRRSENNNNNNNSTNVSLSSPPPASAFTLPQIHNEDESRSSQDNIDDSEHHIDSRDDNNHRHNKKSIYMMIQRILLFESAVLSTLLLIPVLSLPLFEVQIDGFAISLLAVETTTQFNIWDVAKLLWNQGYGNNTSVGNGMDHGITWTGTWMAQMFWWNTIFAPLITMFACLMLCLDHPWRWVMTNILLPTTIHGDPLYNITTNQRSNNNNNKNKNNNRNRRKNLIRNIAKATYPFSMGLIFAICIFVVMSSLRPVGDKIFSAFGLCNEIQNILGISMKQYYDDDDDVNAVGCLRMSGTVLSGGYIFLLQGLIMDFFVTMILREF